MHKPLHTLIFGIFLFGGLGLLSVIFPTEGLSIGKNLALNFPGTGELFGNHSPKKDISNILEMAEAAEASDATNTADTSFVIEGGPDSKLKHKKKDSLVKLITKIQYRNPSVLKKFFDALKRASPEDVQSFHVLHYGDSQIEGDRITDYLRLKLQSQFGGDGPGLISLMPLTASIINKITTSEGWDRYGVFIARDKRVTHNNYGVLAGFNRYLPYKTLYDTSVVVSSSVTITSSKSGGPHAIAYKKFKLFYGGAKKRTWCEFYDGPALISADSLEANGIFNVKEFNVGNGSLTHTLKFRGKDSPDLYAVSLEGTKGVQVDNIALRGSSGTFFHQINAAQQKLFYDHLNVKLIILQFGGNTLPGMKDEKMCQNYGNYLRGQINIIKKLAPGASILFVGPSDMNIKSGTEYVTYPLLETLRDEIKKAVLESDCAFYDMYDSMGGENSMVSWVESKLAATDYIHFSPQGARKIATLFYTALINEYNNYIKSNN